MQTYGVYFFPRGSLASALASDTLFGAVCWAIRLLDLGDLAQILSPPKAPFAFSSTFPFCLCADMSRLRFYPRPAWLMPSVADIAAVVQDVQRLTKKKAARITVLEQAKDFKKKTEFLSEAAFAQAVSGKLKANDILRALAKVGDPCVKVFGSFLLLANERCEIENLLRRATVQRNHIDRLAGATVEGNLFYTQETFFRRGAGLWAALRTEPETLKSLILPALRYLADSGFGADRSTGKGHFDIEVDLQPITLPQAGDDANAWLTLSRYLPAEGELRGEDDALAYEVAHLRPKRERRFAHLEADGKGEVYKKPVRMFEPGSVFRLAAVEDPPGRLAELVAAQQNGWPVYQSGLAVGVPACFPQFSRGGRYE
ncbi:MAG: type III-A CRISPR-associated RAMP protein Csm4 [Anaerolineae bacterium]|nr:type III-A CRISPR-associated RAMP protein Csm4 [Anaerolineae bacterium]